MFWLRLIIGGLVIASVTEVAQRFSPRIAGAVLLIPLVSILGLYLTSHDLGVSATREAINWALLGLMPLAGFFLCANLTIGRMPVTAALALSLSTWLVFTSVLVLIAK